MTQKSLTLDDLKGHWQPVWSAILATARPVESHSRARGNVLAGPPNIFVGPLWGKNF